VSHTAHTLRIRTLAAVLVVASSSSIPSAATAQGRGNQRDTALVARRDSLEKVLESIAVIDRKLMVPMRDGTRIQFDVYPRRPRERFPRFSFERRTT